MIETGITDLWPSVFQKYSYRPTFTTFKGYQKGRIDDIIQYIINDKAVIIFWKNGCKTTAIIHDDDVFDKEFGFALAVFKYIVIKNDISKNSYKREMACIKDDKMKAYLIENFNRVTFKNMEKSRKFLKSLKATGKREKIYE